MAPVFAARWQDPFIVFQVIGNNAYKVRTDPRVTGKRTGYIKNTVNGVRMRMFVDGEVVSAGLKKAMETEDKLDKEKEKTIDECV